MEKQNSVTGTTLGYIGGAGRNQDRKDELPKAVDLSHHLSEQAKNRHPSSLKSFYQYWRKPGVIGLAGGMPPPDYFPFDTLEANTLPSDVFAASPEAALREENLGPISWLWSLFGTKGKHRTEHIKVAKYVSDPTKEINLATALQYSLARGIPQLQEFLEDYSTRFFDPAYADFVVLVHGGNTDGWNRVASCLINKGDGVLVDEWTYPNALSASLPLSANMVGIPMDSRGMRPDALEEVLANWNEEERGFRRPHLLYTVSVGQNPCGLTTDAQRKKEIYDVCVTYDVIICEDDPYFILQAGDYIPKKQREINARHASTSFGSATVNSDEEIQEFIDSLAPSYLKFDYQGRVIRLDTFSKTIAPGSRLGWFTCSPQLAERFERQGEVSTQNPCGFGQSMITQLITEQWGLGGYVRWLRGIRTNYAVRRDALLDAFMDKFDITLASGSGYREGAVVYDARFKQLGGSALTMAEKKLPKVLSFIPPTGGMFLWLEVHFDGLPLSRPEPGESHETRFWTALADKNLLVLPGWLFNGEPGNPPVDPNITGHYRISFSDTTNELMKTAVDILAKVLEEYFKQ